MNFIKIKETCLYVTNLERAKNFYESTLELPLIAYLPESTPSLKQAIQFYCSLTLLIQKPR